jgi:hypothetical protein
MTMSRSWHASLVWRHGDWMQGDSKNRILQGLTRLSNQILSASQRQTLEALTDAHALGCFE